MTKLIRGVLGGVAVGIIGYVVGGIIYGFLFNKWTMMYSQVWRPMESLQWKVGMPVAYVFDGLMVALGYALFYKGIPGEGIKKGLYFGLIFWLISRVPGEFFFYVLIPISGVLTIAGWLHGLIIMALGGMAVAAIYGKSLEAGQ